MGVLRTIVEGADATAAYDDSIKKYPRFEDLWLAWTWRLARGPGVDAIIVPGSDPQHYLVKAYDFSAYDMPAEVTFLFYFTDDEVHILDLVVREASRPDGD